MNQKFDPYPQREKFWAMKFIRILTKTCASQDIGAVGALLLSVVVTTEDAAGYRRAVTYFDGQLVPILGLSSQKQLANTRKKCVEAGWLHYEPGRKGVAGRYWTTLPEHATGLDDAATDEGEFSENGNETGTQKEHKGDENAAQSPRIGDTKDSQREQNGEEMGTKRECNGQPFLPVPIPVPIPIQNSITRESIAADDLTFIEGESKAFVAWWDSYPEGSRTGRRACWNLWPKILIEIQAKIRCTEDQAAKHVLQRTQLFAKSPKGKEQEFRWSAETFLKDGHFDDELKSWEVNHGSRQNNRGRTAGNKPANVGSNEIADALASAGIT